MAKILTNPTPSEVAELEKKGVPLLRVPDVGETVTIDRIEMLHGGARRKVRAGAWRVLRYGGNGIPTVTLEAETRMGIVRQAKARRAWTERLWLTIALSAAAGLVVGDLIGSLLTWWVLG